MGTLKVRACVTVALVSAPGVLLSACGDGTLRAFQSSESSSGRDASADSSPNSPSGNMGGSAGAGLRDAASEPVVPDAASGDSLIVDDFEDGDTESSLHDNGWWYLQNDTTASQSFGIQASPDRPGRNALRTTGGHFTRWGAFVGLNLQGDTPAFDASAFSEIRFWARAEVGSDTDLTIQFIQASTLTSFNVIQPVTTVWQEYALRFADFHDTSGNQDLDPSSLAHVQFFVLLPEQFDIWIDDVVFAR